MSNEANASKGFEFKWVIIAVIAGFALCVSLYQIMSATFHTTTVPTFISLLGLVIMGIIIGFKSPGYTLKEPTVGGALTLVASAFFVKTFFGATLDSTEMMIGGVVGLLLGFVGGWVGEQIQVTPEEKSKELAEEKAGKKLQWGWIAAGTILAFIFNNFFVFGGFAILKFAEGGILMSLGASFLLAGLIVSYFSPGYTIKEPAIAGVFSMILNFILLYLGFDRAILPVEYIIGTLVGGFVLSLIGGYCGEKLQSYMEDRIDE